MVDRRATRSAARGGPTIGKLKKSDVERLLTDYDCDPIVALRTALRIVLDLPDAGWDDLLAAAPLDTGRRQALMRGDESTLHELAAELNECRTLGPVVKS